MISLPCELVKKGCVARIASSTKGVTGVLTKVTKQQLEGQTERDSTRNGDEFYLALVGCQTKSLSFYPQ
jgi:hypothetical protein